MSDSWLKKIEEKFNISGTFTNSCNFSASVVDLIEMRGKGGVRNNADQNCKFKKENVKFCWGFYLLGWRATHPDSIIVNISVRFLSFIFSLLFHRWIFIFIFRFLFVEGVCEGNTRWLRHHQHWSFSLFLSLGVLSIDCNAYKIQVKRLSLFHDDDLKGQWCNVSIALSFTLVKSHKLYFISNRGKLRPKCKRNFVHSILDLASPRYYARSGNGREKYVKNQMDTISRRK